MLAEFQQKTLHNWSTGMKSNREDLVSSARLFSPFGSVHRYTATRHSFIPSCARSLVAASERKVCSRAHLHTRLEGARTSGRLPLINRKFHGAGWSPWLREQPSAAGERNGGSAWLLWPLPVPRHLPEGPSWTELQVPAVATCSLTLFRSASFPPCLLCSPTSASGEHLPREPLAPKSPLNSACWQTQLVTS